MHPQSQGFQLPPDAAPLKPLYSLHLSTARSWRGGEQQIFLLAKGLLACGQRVRVVAPTGAPLLERCAAASIPTRELNICCELDLLGIWRLRRLLAAEKPDILHLHDGHAVLPGKLAALGISREKLRVVAHRRTVFPLRSPGKYSGRVDAVIAISQAVRERVLAAGIDSARVPVVYSGLEFPAPACTDDVAAFRARHALPADAFVIAHAAALTSEKRQADMLAALAAVNAELKASRRPPVHLVVAGCGDQESVLRAQAAERGVAETAHFLGFLTDLRPLWASSQLAFYASEAEGLCTALIEAQGAGRAAVVTRAGGMVEVVEEGRTGRVVEIGDVAAMAAAILNYVDDPASCQRAGEAGAERAREHFSAAAMVKGVLNVYRELCKPAARNKIDATCAKCDT